MESSWVSPQRNLRVKQDERIPQLRGCLPGANCGGCGYAGCDAYARAIVEDSASLDACPVGGASVSAQLAQVMGVEVTQKEKMVAFVQCEWNLLMSPIKSWPTAASKVA
ncbi:MAG: (Fe-S)-binding protein [Clostridia bacterium]